MAELKDRYAAALFEMSVESGELDRHLPQVLFLRDCLKNEGLTELLKNPHIADSSKRTLLNQRFGGKIPGDVMGFLQLMVDKGDEAAIVPALDAYIAMGNRCQGKAVAYVVSAVALSPGQVESLRSVLTTKLGKEMEIVSSVNPDLLGGFYIHVDGQLIDQTVRTGLTNLKETLRKGS